MDYTSLKEITETIIAVLQKAVDDTGNWPGLKVLPEVLRETNNGIGFYLFHVQESSHYKNFPAPGNDTPPVNYTPMALNLFYQLSANNTKNGGEEDAYEEQKMMSVAIKALHDHTVIKKTSDDSKKINIKITLQTLTSNESVQYWAAAQSPVRLSAYYEVSVVFLEPEKQLSYAGRVLSYGNFIFVRGAPQITSSENTIEYKLPGELTSRQVKIQPAQAPPAFIAAAPNNSVISFFGTGFNGGTIKLLLISPKWSEPAFANATWLPTLVSENQLNITVQPTAILTKALTLVDIIPGLYAAQVSITEQRTLPNGTVKTFDHVSNQFPFSVTPRISSISLLVAGVFTVTCNVFQNPGLTSDDIQVYIGETKLILSVAALLAPGEFKITTATTIEIQIPVGIPPGQVALRILIRGIESEPKWITIP